ncbi:hypothetical protein F5887DRAFT_990783, partial [Amanita rubescens]
MHQPALKNMTSRIEDASMSIYQFLIAVRQKDGELLTNEAGESISYLMGFFYIATRIVENGIKPAYMSDGTTRVEEGSGEFMSGFPIVANSDVLRVS